MHLALDLDGTISTIPETFAQIGAAIVAAGHTVTVLTGALHDFPDTARTVEGRTAQLEALGFQRDLHYSDLNICIGVKGSEVARLKRDYCQDHKVDLLIDDEPIYCDAVATVTHVAQFRRPT